VESHFSQRKREVGHPADHMSVNIAPNDVDHLAATLQHKVSHVKTYLT
jgi:hypothetical protein